MVMVASALLGCPPPPRIGGHPYQRPIVDYTGLIGYKVSRGLADLLVPLVGKSIHHTKNSKHLADEIKNVIIDPEDIFNSHDVVSLFTNTPIVDTLSIIREYLMKDHNLKFRTSLTVDDIMSLTKFVATTTCFSFRGTIYRQKFGTAMGSPVSSIMANIFMEWLEERAIATVPLNCKPKLWKRYMDDILEIIHKGEEENLTKHLYTVDTSGSIKFTHESGLCSEVTNVC